MDLYDDIFNDQLFQLSPLRFSSSPEPFASLTEFLQDPLLEETENVDGEAVGFINSSAITEANPSMGIPSPNLVPFPETLTLVQNQSDHHFFLNQNMLDSFEQEPGVFAMPQQSLVCNPKGCLQGNLTNGQLDQQSLFNRITMNPFQETNDSTMIENGRPIEEGNSGYAHPMMTQSFELPNHLQEQFLSLPSSQSYLSEPMYEHGLVASHFNKYDQQPPTLVLPNREDGALVPSMDKNLARTNSAPNQISVTLPLPQMTSNSTRNQGNVQERVNQPTPGSRYPTLETYARAQGLPCTKAFAPIDFNVLGRRQRNDQSRFEHEESSSAAQRRRIFMPNRNDNLTAANLVQERLQNTLYSQLYATLGLKIDPHLRNFAPLPKKKSK
ncbi:hypothetical protein HID58_034618 [Brassica napus]|uniref:Uncharacterized protein n=1 Tax=Brassica napus TaxID=3708 RepID=A0ABQ8C2K1_BRANA|nr:uncharacterized protein LOC111206152 [Brassica napus]KAH0911297.1 hypothetical protein HID58_034618 [Brassica napus]